MSLNKIEIFRTHIEIHDYNLGDSPKLERTFSIYDPVYHKSFQFGIVYEEETKTLMLPRGIDVYWLENIFKVASYVHRYRDERELEINDGYQAKMRVPPRDEIQTTAIRFMCNIDEFQDLYKYSMQSVNLDTGKGKSYCSIASIVIQNMRAIIITSQNGWLEQWRNYLLEYTNIRPKDIKMIKGSDNIDNLFRFNTDSNRVYLVNHSTIHSYAKNNGWRSIGALFEKLKIGIKIFDEAHTNFENMYFIDYYTDVFKTYYVTATPDRSNMRESAIFNLYMKNVPAINLFDQNQDPHSAYMGIKYNSHPTALEAQDCKNAYGLNRNKYASYLMNKKNFYKIAFILISKFMWKPEGKLLIYIGVNKSILIFKEWLENNFPELVGQIGVYTSISDAKSEELNKKVILSTTKSAGAAVDIYGLVQVINLAEPFKSKVLAKQTLGRLRRKNTTYIDIVDTGFYFTKRFYEAKKPVYNKYATKCTEVTLNDEALDKALADEISKRALYVQPIVYYPERLLENGLIKAIEYET